jgi:hypothetical protein
LTETPAKLGLGRAYKGKHSIWQFDFEIEYEDAMNLELLNSDFNLIPVIDGLDETAKFTNSVFTTQDPEYANIFFQIDDK